MNTTIKAVSEQTAAVYKVLGSGKALTVLQIAEQLNVLPNGLYRALDRLVQLGAVEKIHSYPTTYRAISGQLALNLYLAQAAQNFQRELGISKTSFTIDAQPEIEIIKDRETALRTSSKDVRAATTSIDFIVSGFQVNDETVLAFRKATTTGVRVRAIVQQKDEIDGGKLERWQDFGVKVRYLPNLNIRLFVFDQQIVYLASFDKANRGALYGVRFAFVPLAIQMSNLFEQHWQNAKPL